MTDYQKDKAAERWAHKYGRWIVYGFLPAVILIGFLLTFVVFPIICFLSPRCSIWPTW